MAEVSAEHVAYQLMLDIARVEQKLLYHSPDPQGHAVADRRWILDTYAECLAVVRGPRRPTRSAARDRERTET